MLLDTHLFINLIGWIGSAAVIIAYLLVSINRVKSDTAIYQILNLIGGVFLIVNTIYWGAYPSSFVNLVWVGIALSSLVRVAWRQKTR